jgi:hypothetical protein
VTIWGGGEQILAAAQRGEVERAFRKRNAAWLERIDWGNGAGLVGSAGAIGQSRPREVKRLYLQAECGPWRRRHSRRCLLARI